MTGLDFPGNTYGQTCRFEFADVITNGLPQYGPSGQGVTYIWKCYPRQQDSYYTTLFWGEGDGSFDNSCYYGGTPYPDWEGGSIWSLAVDANDYGDQAMVPLQWYTQALVVWDDLAGNKHHIYYWNLPETGATYYVTQNVADPYGDDPPNEPVVMVGDAAWNPGNEIFYGVLRGFQIYSKALSIADILDEIDSPLSTADGAAYIWYLNLNPTPTDIADDSGEGHNPAWVGEGRPTLWGDISPADILGLSEYVKMNQVMNVKMEDA